MGCRCTHQHCLQSLFNPARHHLLHVARVPWFLCIHVYSCPALPLCSGLMVDCNRRCYKSSRTTPHSQAQHSIIAALRCLRWPPPAPWMPVPTFLSFRIQLIHGNPPSPCWVGLPLSLFITPGPPSLQCWPPWTAGGCWIVHLPHCNVNYLTKKSMFTQQQI